MVKLEDVGIDRNLPIIDFVGKKEVIFCFEDELIENCMRKIVETKHRRLPIVDKKRTLVGIITITDLLDAFLRDVDVKEKISEIMIREVIFSYEKEDVGFVLQKMKLARRGGLPVVDKKMKLKNLVSERDFVWLFDKIKFNEKVENVMSKKPFFITPNYSILDALKIMVNVRYRRLPIVENDELKGIVTSLDILEYILKNNFEKESLDEDLNLVYESNVITIEKEEDISEAIKKMKEKDIGGIIVVEGKKLVGVITERDILEKIE